MIKQLGNISTEKSKEVLALIKKKSISRQIDPKITKKIWKNLIQAYIDFEKRNFKKK